MTIEILGYVGWGLTLLILGFVLGGWITWDRPR